MSQIEVRSREKISRGRCPAPVSSKIFPFRRRRKKAHSTVGIVRDTAYRKKQPLRKFCDFSVILPLRLIGCDHRLTPLCKLPSCAAESGVPDPVQRLGSASRSKYASSGSNSQMAATGPVGAKRAHYSPPQHLAPSRSCRRESALDAASISADR